MNIQGSSAPGVMSDVSVRKNYYSLQNANMSKGFDGSLEMVELSALDKGKG